MRRRAASEASRLGRWAKLSLLLAFSAVTAASAAPGALAEVYLWPMHGNRRLSSSFSEYRDGHYHAGIDVRSYGAVGLPCLAVSSGYVARVKIGASGYGKALYLRLNDGRTAVYAHLDQFDAAIDSLAWNYRVSRETNWCDFSLPAGGYAFEVGDTVAFSGKTGTSAPHLHFELRDEAERPFNPLKGVYTVPDGTAPMISGLEVVPLGEGSVTEEGPVPVFRLFRASGSKRYLMADTLQLDGKFGFGVSAWDEQGFGSYRMAPSSIELAVDGQTLYTVNNEIFSYTQADEVSAEYDISGDGPAGRYLLMFPVPGVTRDDRSGEGAVHRGESPSGMRLEKGLHVGLLTVRDASGNSSTGIFHFAIHDFPVIETARRLEAAPEVVASAIDPDGGEVYVRFYESLDGGGSWRSLATEQIGGYHRAEVSDLTSALYRAEATDDEGATVCEWFSSPSESSERDMVFASVEPFVHRGGLGVRAALDGILTEPPVIRCGRTDTLPVVRIGPLEFVSTDVPAPPGAGGRSVAFTLSGRDYRGYPVFSARAVRAFLLDSGSSARFVIADSLEAELEAPSLRSKAAVIVGDVPMPGPAPEGTAAAAVPFSLDFRVQDLARPMRLHCVPGDRVGLFMWEDGKGWRCAGVPAMEGGHVSIDRPGLYAFFRDTLPPEIKHVALQEAPAGSGFFKPFNCIVPVTEDGTGVDPWSPVAVMGGRRMVCEWDTFRKVLVIPVPASFPAGRTVLSVEVSDRAGNRSVGEYGFVIE